MQKILLVIDAYNELVQLEQMLKKLGFDTLGMQNALSMQDRMLGFSPDVVVLSAKGVRVNGLELSNKIKKRKGVPKIVLLFPQGYEPAPSELSQAQMDAVFESPVEPVRFLSGLCKLIGVDSSVLIEKFAKMQGFGQGGEYGHHHAHRAEPQLNKVSVTGVPRPVQPGQLSNGLGAVANLHGFAERDRSQSYREIAAQVTLPGPGGLPHERIQAAIKEWNRNSKPQIDQELDDSRREFVRALFTKEK